MPACGYEFYLLVFSYRVEHSPLAIFFETLR